MVRTTAQVDEALATAEPALDGRLKCDVTPRNIHGDLLLTFGHSSRVPSGLSADEVKQIFRGMNEDPTMRPQARHMWFYNPTQLTTSPIQLPRARLEPDPPQRSAQTSPFTSGAQSLLLTYATNAPEIVISFARSPHEPFDLVISFARSPHEPFEASIDLRDVVAVDRT